MAIFRRVIVTDDEMSYVRGEIVFVNAAKLGDFLSNLGLYMKCSVKAIMSAVLTGLVAGTVVSGKHR